MVLNLSDQDSSHHSANATGDERASVPSPEKRDIPVSRAALAHIARATQKQIDAHREDRDSVDERPVIKQEEDGERRGSSEETPLDFSVRRQDSGDSVRSHESTLDSVGESIPTSPVTQHSPGYVRRSSSSEPMSPDPIPGYRMDDKIGEPRLSLPGFPPGFLFPPIPGQLPPGFPMNLMANFNLFNSMQQSKPQESGKTEKASTRPFKAYPKDPLSLPLGYFGMPGVPPLPGIDASMAQAFSQMNSEDMFKQYRNILTKRMEQERHPEKARHSPSKARDVALEHPLSPVRGSPPQHPSDSLPNLPVYSPRHQQPPHPSPSPLPSPLRHQLGAFDAFRQTPASEPSHNSQGDEKHESTPTSTGQKQAKKRGRNSSSSDGSLVKDEAYWERRRKNNDAAKRSRDSRRAKEDEIAIRAAYLEQENLKLRVEVAALRNETAKLRCLLYNN